MPSELAFELPPRPAEDPLHSRERLAEEVGGSAETYPKPDEWAKIAIPFLLKLGAKDNGRQLTVPIRGAND